jgi:hypothetical protein
MPHNPPTTRYLIQIVQRTQKMMGELKKYWSRTKPTTILKQNLRNVQVPYHGNDYRINRSASDGHILTCNKQKTELWKQFMLYTIDGKSYKNMYLQPNRVRGGGSTYPCNKYVHGMDNFQFVTLFKMRVTLETIGWRMIAGVHYSLHKTRHRIFLSLSDPTTPIPNAFLLRCTDFVSDGNRNRIPPCSHYIVLSHPGSLTLYAAPVFYYWNLMFVK